MKNEVAIANEDVRKLTNYGGASLHFTLNAESAVFELLRRSMTSLLYFTVIFKWQFAAFLLFDVDINILRVFVKKFRNVLTLPRRFDITYKIGLLRHTFVIFYRRGVSRFAYVIYEGRMG